VTGTPAGAGNAALVTLGMDDFADKLVGGSPAIVLPEVGAPVRQGERGWSLLYGSQSVDMLSPVDGTVVAVNERVARRPGAGRLGAYDDGGLLKVTAPRLATNAKQRLSGAAARRWMESVGDPLRARMSPDLGLVYQDGGMPIEGMAQDLDPARWDEIARAFFLYHTYPSLKGPEDHRARWDGLTGGGVSTVGTDEFPTSLAVTLKGKTASRRGSCSAGCGARASPRSRPPTSRASSVCTPARASSPRGVTRVWCSWTPRCAGGSRGRTSM
jgi:glycine cleavage system H lipoate-binding protein